MKNQRNSFSMKFWQLGLMAWIFLTASIALNAQDSYPYHFVYEGNPLSRIHGAADPDAHVWDDTIWVYCSQDHDGGYRNMDGYHAFSSTDLIHWTDHGDVFNSTMLNEKEWGPTPDHWMWAPGAARKQDESGSWTYFLYYPHNNKFDGEHWVTGVATAPTPAGPFTDQGPLKGGSMGMDPMVFIDDDGQAYIYSNSLIVAKLNPDMISLAESPRKIKYAPEQVLNNKNLRFSEGSYMHKKEGVYYYSYSNFHNDDFQAFYATGNNPYGPFEWKGPMAPNPQGAQDHHSLIDFQDQWYYFYHIAIPDIPENKDGQGRIVCFDKLNYNKDGSIQMVVHTRGPKSVLKPLASKGTLGSGPKKTSAAATSHNYSADLSSVFPNPERGWHNRRDIDDGDGIDNRNFSDVVEAGYTLVHSYLRLDDFKETDDIPQSYLDAVQEGLDAIREYGLKIVLRPTHVWNTSPSVPEARILRHIEQVNAVISANADVVCHLETGYLGKWGEWHSGWYTELSRRSDGDTRYRIIKKILETTPDNMPIAMRYPMHIREILDELPVPDDCEPLTQVERDRLGHHNDCFLFNENDRGTYARNDLWFGEQSLEEQKEYAFDMITSYGGNKIMGGETCSPTIERIDDTQSEMAKANWTEININFWGKAIEMWRNRMLPASGNDPAESEFDRISRKLGYRLRLIDATFPLSANAGESFTIGANLSNDGYAGVIKMRPVFLVFDNGTDRYNIQLSNVDVRTWLSGQVELSPQTVSLPSDMKPGSYKLALWLPDAATGLQMRPAYSIRFANHEVWDNIKGYNLLSDSVIIRKKE